MDAARIAIVDDDELFAGYLSAFLRTRGYDVAIYSSGREFLQALAANAPPALVLLDVLMPGLDGIETLRALRQTHAKLPVIMVSGQQVPATIVDAVRMGAVDYVLKPGDASGVQEAALEATVCRAIERVTLTDEVARLSAQQPDEADGAQVCWQSGRTMEPIMTMVERVADSDVSVLVTGESGVGKEVIARELHRRSARRLKPFVKVNCAALPAELLESELFGHERGAFTGAQAPRIGRFEYADAGTLMLDEIAEIPVGLQAKLLQVLQDGEVTRLGSNRAVPVGARVVAATNRDLGSMISTGQFRKDLFYRLQVIEIRVPPLRERREEIPALIDFFLRRYATQYGRPLLRPSEPVHAALVAHDWPGNIRELENRIKRFVILRDDAVLLDPALEPRQAADDTLPAPTPVAPRPARERANRLPDIARAAAVVAERRAIQDALDQVQWNRIKAAKKLGVSYKTLLNKMKECGLS